MAGDANQTRRRLLEAATVEFANYGIAGARVDRIAAEAGANKSLLYAYFGNKEELFRVVFDAMAANTMESAPFDAENLPDYAGRLFDHYRNNPMLYRLAGWWRLEHRERVPQIDSVMRNNDVKLRAIAEAQAKGQVTTRFSPAELLNLVLTIAGMWNVTNPETTAMEAPDAETIARQRQTVVEAVKLVIERR